MPIYEYACSRCGPFAISCSMDGRHAPQPCPVCALPAARGIFTAPALGALSAPARRAHALNERAAHEPKLASAAPSARAAGSGGAQAACGRPWMIGH